MLSQHHRCIDLASTLTFALGVAGFASAALMGCTQGDILAGAAPIAQVGSEVAVGEPNFA